MRRLVSGWSKGVQAAFTRRLALYKERLKREPVRVALEILAALALAASLFSYLGAWWSSYERALTDPAVQTDDARTALFAFHRYGADNALADDPIANEMIVYQPPAFRLIYWLTVPMIGLLAAAKVAQGLCLLIIVAGAVVLWRSRRAGAATAAIFLFLMLRDGFVMDRVGGGLPRSFGFPVMALWFAGALAHSTWTRRVACGLAALTYPSALAMVLGAEGFYALRRLGRPGWATALRRAKQYAIVVAASAALFAPTVIFGSSDGGPVHTLAQAENEPAFGRAGRLYLLPLGDPGVNFGKQLSHSFRPYGDGPWLSLQEAMLPRADEVTTIFFALMFLLPLLGLTPIPGAVVAFVGASLTIYALSVVFAFRLYSPERYYSYGMHMTAIGLATSTLGLLLPRLRYSLRQPVRNALGAVTIFFLFVWLGVGAPRTPMAMTINYNSKAPLWEFIKELPQDIRIASFISDGDDIPLFAKRANNGGYETMQPWLTGSWARQLTRAQDTLRAFYTSDPEELFDYAEKYKVTHLLVNRTRYRSDFVKRARTFQPLSSFSNELLSDRNVNRMVLANVPEDAIIYQHRQFSLVEVKALREALRGSS